MKTTMRVDNRFDEIMLFDIKLKIAEAFLSMESNMRIGRVGMGQLGELHIMCIEKKANQMKEEINSFIDSQVKRLQMSEQLGSEMSSESLYNRK